MSPSIDQPVIDALAQGLRRKEAPKTAQSNGHTTSLRGARWAAGAYRPSDSEVLEKLFGEPEGQKWRDVYGNAWAPHYDSQSSADAAMLRKLAFWTGGDSDQMERIMRGSGLARQKWDSRRGGSTWLADEITRAIEDTPEVYSWQNADSQAGRQTAPQDEGCGRGNEGTGGPGPISASDLMRLELPAVAWAVPDILPAGVSLLAGKPKLGKSWLALGLCEAVASGGVALGTKRVERGETLYLALEDNHRRLQKRLRKVLDGREAPEGMYLHTDWPRLPEGGVELLREWLTDHPSARLVVIDTLAKIRAPAKGKNVYAEDYAALEGLVPLAAEFDVSIVVVHHLRKAGAADPIDEISSSTGLTAGVDGFLILRRDRSGKGATLLVDGRDVEEPAEYALHWNLNTATWAIEGDAGKVRVSNQRADILLVVRRNGGPMSPAKIADTLDKNPTTIRRLLQKMRDDGQIVDTGSGYTLPREQREQREQGITVEPELPVHDGQAGVNKAKGDSCGENAGGVHGVHGVHADSCGDDEHGSSPEECRC